MTDEPDRARPDQAVLVLLLVVMTFVTGVVDAVSFLRLDHVFVGNMTGNVVFLGFGLAGAPGFSGSASLVALAAFLAGAVAAGQVSRPTRRRMLAPITAAEAVLCTAATVIAFAADGTTARYTMTVLLAVAMGAQNAIVRRLAVPDMTTINVLTSTLTALATDHPDLGRPGSHSARRVAIVVALFAGALVGVLIVLHASPGWALATAAALLAAVAVGAGTRTTR